MSFELTGKLIVKYDIQQKTESFKSREFVIEKVDDVQGRMISNYVKFQCTQDRTTMVDRFNIGDDVKVSFNIRGTKWNKDGKDLFFTNLDAWRMETVKMGGEPAAQTNDLPDNFLPTDNVVDDLPF
jgi:hypothetical protein